MKENTNKLSCGIVRDLLPLYHDDIVSDETKAAVADHLADCGECSAELEKLGAELPEIKESSAARFISMMKRNKLMLILKYCICYTLVLLAIYGVIRFASNKPVIKLDPEDIEIVRLYHYKNDDCELPFCPHAMGSDDSLFIYCKVPTKTDINYSMRETIEGGNKDISFYKRALDLSKIGGKKEFDQLYIVHLDDGITSVSVNGKVVWQEGDPEPELPPYVEAYHQFEYGGQDASWYTESDSFTFECDGKRTVWDLDGNVIANLIYDEETGEYKPASANE